MHAARQPARWELTLYLLLIKLGTDLRGSAARAISRAGARGAGPTPHADVFKAAVFPEEVWPTCTWWHGLPLPPPSEVSDGVSFVCHGRPAVDNQSIINQENF